MYIRSASSPSTVLWAFHTIQPSSYIYIYCFITRQTQFYSWTKFRRGSENLLIWQHFEWFCRYFTVMRASKWWHILLIEIYFLQFQPLSLLVCRNGGISTSCPKAAITIGSQRRQFHVKGLKWWRFGKVSGIFCRILTTHVQKRLFLSFRSKFWHLHLIWRSRFPKG